MIKALKLEIKPAHIELKTILLVEDEAVIAAEKAVEVASFGYKVITANSGEEAVELAKNEVIDLILMDIDLGSGMDGTEAARTILNKRALPIVFLTAHSGRAMVEKVRGISRYGHVAKDSGEVILQTSIEMALELFEAHAAVQSSKMQFERTISMISDAVWNFEVNALGEPVSSYVSPVGDHLLGLPIGTIGNDFEKHISYIHPEDRSIALEMLSSGLRLHKKDQKLEYRMVRPDGTIMWVITKASAYAEEGGNTKGYGTTSDITERKQAEKALLIKDWAISSAINPIAISDLDGTLNYVNPAFLKTWGYASIADIPKKSVLAFWPTDKKSEEIIAKLKNNEGWVGEMMTKRKDGTSFPVRVAASMILDNKGQPIAMQASFEDITERKLAEDMIKALLAEKEVLLKEVHHRIKNNMLILMSLFSFRSNNLEDNPEAIAALQDAKSSVQSMLVLYDKLYRAADFSMLSLEKYLPKLVDEVVRLYPHSASVRTEKHIEAFALDVKTLAPLGILVNELLTNIMKYAFSGRDTGLITIFAKQKGNQVTIVVQDDGIGIPEEVDLESTIGHGLHLVGVLTKQLKGSIKIERDQGTKFILEFEV